MSRKSLSMLESMDQDIARDFAVLCSQAIYLSIRPGIVTQGLILTLSDNIRAIMPHLGIEPSFMRRFQEYALVREHTSDFVYHPQLMRGSRRHLIYQRVLHKLTCDDDSPFTFSCHYLTHVGLELSTAMPLVLDHNFSENYHDALQTFLKLSNRALTSDDPPQVARFLRAVESA